MRWGWNGGGIGWVGWDEGGMGWGDKESTNNDPAMQEGVVNARGCVQSRRMWLWFH